MFAASDKRVAYPTPKIPPLNFLRILVQLQKIPFVKFQLIMDVRRKYKLLHSPITLSRRALDVRFSCRSIGFAFCHRRCEPKIKISHWEMDAQSIWFASARRRNRSSSITPPVNSIQHIEWDARLPNTACTAETKSPNTASSRRQMMIIIMIS